MVMDGKEDVERPSQMVDLAQHKGAETVSMLPIDLVGLKDTSANNDFIALVTKKLPVHLIPHPPIVNVEEPTPNSLNSSM